MMNSIQLAVQFVAQYVTGTLTPRAFLTWFAWVLFLSAIPSALAQALPAAEAGAISTGFSLPHTAGTFNYAVSGSESVSWGYYSNQGLYAGTSVSGDAAFLSGSKLYPFSMVFSGGYSWANSSQPSYGFLNLSLSQVVNLKRWSILGSDSVSYLPSTPTTGLSGIPGLGDLGVLLGPLGQGVLTVYSDRVMNTTSASIQRQLTGKTSLNAFGSYAIMRFLGSGNEGLDNNTETGGVGFSHQVNARNSFGANYSYTNFSYPGNSGIVPQFQSSFNSQTASGEYTHQFSRRFAVNASVGPQWTTISSSGGSPLVGVYSSASAQYQEKFSQASVYYTRGTNAGYGVIAGAVSQGGGGTVSRTFARVWNIAGSASYTQTSELPAANFPSYSFDTTVMGVQSSRAIVRSVSVYASYTFEHQSSAGAAAVDAFNGNVQVLGFGATYSPPSIHVGRQ